MKERPREPLPQAAPDAAAPATRRFAGGRKLLVATIGAVTVHYAAACSDGERWGTFVANLMAAPRMPEPGGFPAPGGRGGTGSTGGAGGTAGAGEGGRGGEGAQGGSSGAGGAGADLDAGSDDDGGSP